MGGKTGCCDSQLGMYSLTSCGFVFSGQRPSDSHSPAQRAGSLMTPRLAPKVRPFAHRRSSLNQTAGPLALRCILDGNAARWAGPGKRAGRCPLLKLRSSHVCLHRQQLLTFGHRFVERIERIAAGDDAVSWCRCAVTECAADFLPSHHLSGQHVGGQFGI